MTAPQPEETPAKNSREALIFGVYDRLYDHGHCVPNVVLVPATAECEPDWDNAGPANMESLPADEWPEDPVTAQRAAVLIDHIDGCDSDTSLLLFLRDDGNPSIVQIAGPTADGDIAMRIVGRDIGAEPPVREPTPLQDSIAKLFGEAEPPPRADNDNHDARLRPFAAAFGGEIRGNTLFGAEVGDRQGQISFDAAGTVWLYTDRGARIVTLPEATRNLSYVCPAEWQGEPVPERAWWAPDLIPMRQVTILNGDGGVGKSLLALQMAAAGAMQCETLGFRPMPGRAMYLGAEDEASEFHRRLADSVHKHQRQLSDLQDFMLLPLADVDALLSFPDKSGAMQPTPLWLSFADDARDFGPKLIVLDTAADLYGGDEIKRGQVRQFISMLRKLAIEIDCAVVLLAHPSVQGMQSGSGSSGSTAWNNSVRSRLYLTVDKEDDELRILRTMKANYSAKGGEIRLRWREGAFVLDDGKPTQATGLLNKRADEAFRTLLSEINRGGERVAPTKGVNYAPSVMAGRAGAGGLSKKALEGAMHRLLADGLIKVVMDGPPSRQRQRLIVTTEDFGPEE